MYCTFLLSHVNGCLTFPRRRNFVLQQNLNKAIKLQEGESRRPAIEKTGALQMKIVRPCNKLVYLYTNLAFCKVFGNQKKSFVMILVVIINNSNNKFFYYWRRKTKSIYSYSRLEKLNWSFLWYCLIKKKQIKVDLERGRKPTYTIYVFAFMCAF